MSEDTSPGTLTYIRVNDSVRVEEEFATEEFGDWSRSTEHNITGFSVVEQKSYQDLVVNFPIDHEKPYYLLYVLYSTGDSFGHATGEIEFLGLFETREIAQENAQRVREHYDKFERSYDIEAFSITLLTNGGTSFQMNVPWMGYFESIEEVVVMEVRSGGGRWRY